MAVPDRKEFEQRMRRIEGLIQAAENLRDPDAQAIAKELMQALLELHGAGIERMLDITYETGATGQAIIDELASDDLVSNLLLLHGLHPLGLETRVMQALEKVRPYMRSHGGNVELLGVTPEGVVKLRLEGSCHSCPSSRVTLKYAVEEAIYAVAPDVTAIEAEGAIEQPSDVRAGFIPVAQLLGDPSTSSGYSNGANGDGWVTVQGLLSLQDGSLRTMNVSGLPILFCRVGEPLYAYSNTCPNCGQLLGQAKLAGNELACATCGHRYDVMRAGRDLDEPRLHLDPFPLLEERGEVRIALPIPQM